MSHVTSKDGTQIAFDKQGDGPPLILVGGAFQYRAFDQPTQQLAALLAEYFTVFQYDRRGRGESGDTQPYAVEHEVEDIEALVTEAGGSAALFGNSSGATLAVEAAAVLGPAVTKLALFEAPYVVDDSRDPIPDDYVEQLTKLLAADRRGDAVELFMTTVAGAPAEMVAGMRAMPFFGGFEAVAHTLLYDAAVSGDNRPPKAAASVTAPALVVTGGASPSWFHSGAEALTEALPNAEHRVLEGQSHDVAPDVFAPVLVEFFAA